MKRKWMFLFTALVLFGLMLPPIGPAGAQGPLPPTPPPPPEGPGRGPTNGAQRDENGRWFMPAGAQVLAPDHAIVTLAVGGPDDFGYTWDDTVAFNWIDATNGIDAGLGGYSCGQAVGPITLPFPFDYYENTYAELWINAGGYLAFSGQDAWWGCGPMGTRFPEPGHPTNLIAPLWSRLNLANSGSANRVYYTSGGTDSDRYFVVEWYQVEYAYLTHPVFTYEVILYENGDIRFQYHTINGGSYYCDDVAIGIENSNGYDGLSYLDWCEVPPSNKAVLFTRPPDSARIQLLNPYRGTFTQPHKLLTYKLQIVNNGTLGTDLYNLTTTSTWPLTFYNTGGIPLTDTNGDGIVDSGQFAQGATFTLVAEAQTPTVINPTDQNNMTVTITSAKDTSKSKIATLQAAVPVPFAQSFVENEMGLYLVKPGGQQESIISGWGYDMAIDETPNQGFAYVWHRGRWLDENYTISVEEIKYTVLDSAGIPTRATTILVDHSGATIDTCDDNPTVAVASNGSIGVLWDRWLVNETGQRNYNIYFAILSPTGDISFGPVNVTNNNVWGNWNALNVPLLYSASIAVTGDNRFFLTWYQGYDASNNDRVGNIAYTIRDTNGVEIKPPTLLTNDIVGASREYSSPSVAQISNQQALVAFIREESSVSDLYFTVLDSNGNIVKSMKNLSNDGVSGGEIGRPDIAQFSDGNVAIAWNTWDDTRFAVLDTSFNRIAGPTTVSHPAMPSQSYYPITYLSLAVDTTGHVALTWADSDWNNSRNLYYALLNRDGTLQTPPMIFLSSDTSIVTGAQGYSSTSYTFNPTTPGVDTNIQAPSANLVPPNGTIGIPIQFGNNGSALATSVTITATLGNGLTYMGDNSGVTPTTNTADSIFSTNNTQYTWTFSTNMAFLGSGQFDLYVGIGNVDIGTSYPITITISSAESDDITSNNTFSLTVVAAQKVFLPLVTR